MLKSRLLCVHGLLLVLFLSGCSALKHGDDPNYSTCKALERKIMFQDNSTLFSTNPISTYSLTAAENDPTDKERAEEDYDHLGCEKYEFDLKD